MGIYLSARSQMLFLGIYAGVEQVGDVGPEILIISLHKF